MGKFATTMIKECRESLWGEQRILYQKSRLLIYAVLGKSNNNKARRDRGYGALKVAPLQLWFGGGEIFLNREKILETGVPKTPHFMSGFEKVFWVFSVFTGLFS